MKKTLLATIALAWIASCATQKENTADQKLASEAPAPFALSIDRYRNDLEKIASDDMQGRAPGAAGEKRFVPWLVAQYQAIGLEPGNAQSYTQAVPMMQVQNDMTAPLSFKRNGQNVALLPGQDYVLLSKRAESKVEIKDAELVFVGYGVDQPNEQWNDYASVDVKGKIVVVLINDPGFHVGDEKLFKGKAMTYAGRWSYKFEEAARKGALGCLIVHDDKGAAYPWEVVQNGAARPDFDLLTANQAVLPLAAQGWIRGDVAASLFAGAGLKLEDLRIAANQRGFKAVSLGTTASASITRKVQSTSSDNVLGMVRGSESPDEFVVYTAHWDHLGRNFGLVGDQIYNGAIDNGTGVAALLELARAVKASKPKRSALFLAVTLEESGLLGSRYYAENPVYPLNKTVANINIDALPLIGPSKDVVVVGAGNSELEDIMLPLAQAQGREVVPEPTPENGFYFRSDHFNFAKLGVPALYLKAGQNHSEKGPEYGKAWADAYTKDRYHKPSDEFDANADYRGAIADIALMRDVGLSLLNSNAWPNWYEKSEFRATRDRMMKNDH